MNLSKINVTTLNENAITSTVALDGNIIEIAIVCVADCDGGDGGVCVCARVRVRACLQA